MPSAKKEVKKNVKKFVLKTQSDEKPNVDEQEASASYKLCQKVKNSKDVNFKTILSTCNMEQIQSIASYVKHDKSNTITKVERLGYYAPEILQLQRLRDYVQDVIEYGVDLIHDSIVRSCQSQDGNFDIETLKSLIDKRIGALEENQNRMS